MMIIKSKNSRRRTALLQSTAIIFAISGYAAMAADTGFDNTGFSITLDNSTIAGAPYVNAPLSNSVDVNVAYDGFDTRQLLNVMTDDSRNSFSAGEHVDFVTSSNYPAYISRGEIQIIDLAARGTPVVARITASPNSTAAWQMPADGSGNYAYIYRVYDSNGRFDETIAVRLNRASGVTETQAASFGPAVVNADEDHTARRGISVRGGLVTASGSATPGGSVVIMGETVPVDASGKFSVSRLLPVGDQVVTVDSDGQRVIRDIEIPASEWFHVAIADVTAGWRYDGAGNEDPSYVNGRVAYYVKGQTASGWRITSSLDTGDGPIEDILTRLNDKDPQRVLERLRSDGNDLYPTYGDDSTYYDDTPTMGRVYFRAENENLSVMWGDFAADLASATLLQNSRDLYGAEIRYQSTAATQNGEARVSAVINAAQPETVPQRDILQGTGGSVYFLSHQDISGGSLDLAIEVVDKDTGRVISRTSLQQGIDYTIDHVQGMLLLSSTLSSGGSGSGVVSGSDEVINNLVAQYEYTPTALAVDESVVSGRAEAWVNDNLRVAATAMQEQTAAGEQLWTSADALLRFGKSSFVELEVARVSGPGAGYTTSTDGGLTIISIAGTPTGGADAISLNSHFELTDLGMSQNGHFGIYYENKGAGFATLSETITDAQTILGVEGEIDISDRLTFGFDAEQFQRSSGDSTDEGEIRVAFDPFDKFTVEAGLHYLDQVTIGDPTKTGERLSAGLRLIYNASEQSQYYVFAQTSLNNSGGLASNERYGLGFDTQLTDELSLAAEVSSETAGLGGSARISYATTAQNEVYLGYTLDPTRAGAGGALQDQGRFVLGGKNQLSDSLSTYAETVFDQPDHQRSLTQIYGVNYAPDAYWSLGSTFELGEVTDSLSGDFDRMAASLGTAYDNGEGRNWRARVEYRDENGVGTTRDRTTWGLSAGFTNMVNDDWRLLGSVDALHSQSAESDFRNGEYVRASVGYAFRPVDNEKLNLLFRATYLRDLPGEDQISANGSVDGPLQVSSILSLNAGYDLSPSLTVGAKLGYRMSQIATRGTTAFTENTAALAVTRLDWHVVHNWDIMGEARIMHTVESGIDDIGGLVGVYRHMGDNLKLGVGYEFGAVSDEMESIDYTGQGLFLNLVAKY